MFSLICILSCEYMLYGFKFGLSVGAFILWKYIGFVIRVSWLWLSGWPIYIITTRRSYALKSLIERAARNLNILGEHVVFCVWNYLCESLVCKNILYLSGLRLNIVDDLNYVSYKILSNVRHGQAQTAFVACHGG